MVNQMHMGILSLGGKPQSLQMVNHGLALPRANHPELTVELVVLLGLGQQHSHRVLGDSSLQVVGLISSHGVDHEGDRINIVLETVLGKLLFEDAIVPTQFIHEALHRVNIYHAIRALQLLNGLVPLLQRHRQ